MDLTGIAGVSTQIERLAQAALLKKPSVLTVPNQPKGKYLLIDADGKATEKTTEPEWHDEHLDTPHELRRFVDNNKGEESAIFYDEERVVFVTSLADRRDRAVCELVKSEPYIWLASKPNAQNQKDFVRTLRILLRGCLDASSTLIQLVRDLKFSTNGEVEGSIQHGNESMGRKIANQVTGQGAIPEEVTLRVRVFENHPFQTTIACALEILPAEGAFRLTPYPLEIAKAMDDTLANVAFVFSDEGLPPFYRGHP